MRKEKVLQLAKGMWGRSKSCPKLANNRVEKALKYQYRDRRVKKREFRKSWIMSINAAAREHNLKYGELIHGLTLSNIELDRKALANLAITEPLSFEAVVKHAQLALAEKYADQLKLMQIRQQQQ